ncbi:MAG: hypothetical protein KGZ25_02635, partial [Planctomycetes bacterium]|nr:hypothetical protein [Planctomycetota bacterium]
VGQFGVDTEYYIASPTDTPRHTLRWGFKLKRGYAGVREGIEAWQDVLHLQLPGSGHYFVAMFPRQQDAPAPTFETLGDGKIINVSGEFGTDYVFLSDKETDVEAGAVRFGGRAGSVQDRKTGTLLGLGTGGSVSYGKNELISKTAASLRATQDRLIVRVETAEAPRNVRFRAPGEWVLQDGDAESRLVAEEDALQLTIAAGVERVVLVRASD